MLVLCTHCPARWDVETLAELVWYLVREGPDESGHHHDIQPCWEWEFPDWQPIREGIAEHPARLN